MGVLDAGGGNQRLNGDGGLVDDGKQNEVPDSGERVGSRSEASGSRERLHVYP